MSKKIFINRRRKGNERRASDDPCKNMDIDVYHRKRRTSTDRRQSERTLGEDYHAYHDEISPENSEDFNDTSTPLH